MHTRNILNKTIIALLAAALALTIVLPSQASAQAGSAMDLVNAVNAYRAQYGLAPYSVDGTLMSLAQGHSEYQASIGDCTHTRADGTGPDAYGISAENIACGGDMSVQTAVYGQWSADSIHIATMLGPSEGLIGAGAVNSGGKVYYTLAVKRIQGEFVFIPPTSTPGGEPAAGQPAGEAVAAVNYQGMLTSTPGEDGSIAHVLDYGETLVQVAEAYGISLADLISMNKLDPNNPVYYENQVLIVRLAFTETPFMTATYTPRPATRTPMPTRTPRPTRTITPIRSPQPTRTNTAPPLVQLPSIDDLGPARPLLAYTFIAISVVGLLVLIFTAFLPDRHK